MFKQLELSELQGSRHESSSVRIRTKSEHYEMTEGNLQRITHLYVSGDFPHYTHFWYLRVVTVLACVASTTNLCTAMPQQ